ncbi:MAG: CPBP family intramembrane glutamic endopeptidase [Planctomycetota bacterium]
MHSVLFIVAAVGLLAASIYVWTSVTRRWFQGMALVEPEPRDAPCWGPLDVVLAIILLLTFSSLAHAAVSQWFDLAVGTPPPRGAVSYHYWNILASAFASLATLATTAAVIMLRCRVSLRAFGFVPETAWRDVGLGIKAFLAFAPPVYVLQYLLVQWVDSKHPIVELLRDHPEPRLILASLGSAVVVAPLVEEFLFRGLFQGWLEKLVSRNTSVERLRPGEIAERQQPSAMGSERLASEQGTWNHDPNPYAPATPDVKPAGAGNPVGGTEYPTGFVGALPVLASSTLFAALHMAHGPDWIPLFFLALGLGYLYRQTHRLLPCVTVHLLLNGCSMGMLLLELLAR